MVISDPADHLSPEVVVDGTATFSFLMPTSNGEAEKAGSTTTSGDRWSAGSDITMFSQIGGTPAVAAVEAVEVEDCTDDGETVAEDCTDDGETPEEDCTDDGETPEEDCTDSGECDQATIDGAADGDDCYE